ncbi:uncharacterized protein BP01DRAFT_408855 [Aspergillus saccharolyticus JOP 1030-1]|uniref:Uncharacterized protein n=1 Tax=Aspergillus saccharolyticus JOP 1030-1 TaxID=1450539 RepID=A0A318Z7P4_9EURO|nr:hypothetical protein BP01DRAFT_408855 [Aspergillus saccharolyticus JOP 1030-1]PYH40793.1 hypothetical protein BP01DRAFT_408855 [Aspergillus saccharolyticus JOP 1030-1]
MHTLHEKGLPCSSFSDSRNVYSSAGVSLLPMRSPSCKRRTSTVLRTAHVLRITPPSSIPHLTQLHPNHDQISTMVQTRSMSSRIRLAELGAQPEFQAEIQAGPQKKGQVAPQPETPPEEQVAPQPGASPDIKVESQPETPSVKYEPQSETPSRMKSEPQSETPPVKHEPQSETPPEAQPAPGRVVLGPIEIIPDMWSDEMDEATDMVSRAANLTPDDRVNALRMSSCWLTLLDDLFPGPNTANGYQVAANNSNRYHGAINLRLNVLSNWVQTDFLSVELGVFPSEADDLDRWMREADLHIEMNRCLRDLPAQEGPRTVFGVLGIGKWCRFYESVGVGVHEPIQIAGKRVFHMYRDARQIAYIFVKVIKEQW